MAAWLHNPLICIFPYKAQDITCNPPHISGIGLPAAQTAMMKNATMKIRKTANGTSAFSCTGIVCRATPFFSGCEKEVRFIEADIPYDPPAPGGV
jgi:hypothetical protein